MSCNELFGGLNRCHPRSPYFMQGNTSMFRAQAKRLLELLLRLTPVAVRDRLLMHLLYRTSDAVRYQFGFPTMAGLLGHLAENGFNPTLIVDIGACVGDWGTMAAGIFLAVQIVMIDGNPDNRIALGEMRSERSVPVPGIRSSSWDRNRGKGSLFTFRGAAVPRSSRN